MFLSLPDEKERTAPRAPRVYNYCRAFLGLWPFRDTPLLPKTAAEGSKVGGADDSRLSVLGVDTKDFHARNA